MKDLIILFIIIFVLNSSYANDETFDLGYHNCDFEYTYIKVDYPYTMHIILEYTDGCILEFYVDKETEESFDWKWIHQVNHSSSEERKHVNMQNV